MKYSKPFLRKLYTMMVRIRLFEEKLAEEVLAGNIKTPCHLYVGQEAIATGVCAALRKRDYIFGTHRSHGHFLAKGGDMKPLMAEIYGKATGCSRGRGGSMHLGDLDHGFLGAQPLVAGTIPLAVGTALASSIKKDHRVTVAFFGDGATEEGVFHEALNFAGIKKLPIIFICENNFYSSHLNLKERRQNNIYKHGVMAGMPGIRIDGNDVLEVYEAAKRAVAHAKSGKGAFFIEAVTYRLKGHVGAHDNIADQDIRDIRNPKEVEKWLRKEPIGRFEKYLKASGAMNDLDFQKIEEVTQKEVDNAYRFAMKSPYPKPSELTKYVFS